MPCSQSETFFVGDFHWPVAEVGFKSGLKKTKRQTSIVKLENSIVICKIDDCLMFRFFSVDVGNQFSRRTPPSILSRQYLAKLGLTLPVERYWGILATIWKRQGDSFWNKKGRHRTIWMVYPFDVDFSLNPMMGKGVLSESKKRQTVGTLYREH